jgi:DNA-binding NtrC family response regulator
MTRVLVVHHDVDVADIEVDDLRRAGYEVDQCAGPVGGDACPVLQGQPCWQVDQADVLVYDEWAAGDGRRGLIDDLREVHPDKPVVLTSGGLLLDWVEGEGPHGVTPALGPPNQGVLAAAVEAALRSRSQPTSEAAPPASRAKIPTAHSWPRW